MTRHLIKKLFNKDKNYFEILSKVLNYIFVYMFLLYDKDYFKILIESVTELRVTYKDGDILVVYSIFILRKNLTKLEPGYNYLRHVHTPYFIKSLYYLIFFKENDNKCLLDIF